MEKKKVTITWFCISCLLFQFMVLLLFLILCPDGHGEGPLVPLGLILNLLGSEDWKALEER